MDIDGFCLFLQPVDDEEAREHGAAVEHHQLAALAGDPGGVEVLLRLGARPGLRHAARDDPAQEHGPPPGRGPAAPAGVRAAAAVEGPDARGVPAAGRGPLILL